jgi:hypothetical protein
MTPELLILMILTASIAGGYGLGYRHGFDAGQSDYERKLR